MPRGSNPPTQERRLTQPMACTRREKTGNCGHFQCPHQDETPHGYQCVDVIAGYCECGAECMDADVPCPFRWHESDWQDVIVAFERAGLA
jgi:hypothetical protein